MSILRQPKTLEPFLEGSAPRGGEALKRPKNHLVLVHAEDSKPAPKPEPKRPHPIKLDWWLGNDVSDR